MNRQCFDVVLLVAHHALLWLMVIGFSCVSFESKDAVFQGHDIKYTPVSDDVKQNHNYFCRFLFFILGF